jgi:hypothetical protein
MQPANGPASNWPNSITLNPSNGLLINLLPLKK